MTQKEAFEQFQNFYQEIRHYAFAAARIQWDMETAAPKKALRKSVEAYTFFRTKIFAMTTDPAYGALLKRLSEPKALESLPPAWRHTVQKSVKQYQDFIRIPADFYQKTVQDRATSEHVWQEAKRADDFSLWAPYLKQEIENARKTCTLTDPGKDVYDVLLSKREPGMDVASVDRVFTELKDGLSLLLPRILEQPAPDFSAFRKKYEIAHEREACLYLLKYIGFDFEAGRMDEVEHPLTAGTGRNDVRVSNHFYENDGIDPLFSIIHEGGHGLFAQGADEALEGTDAEHCASAGLNEGMARFLENMIGRNEHFWAPVYWDLQKCMPELQDIPLSLFYRKINDVRPGFIRTRADEVTYCMHIILRHELEKLLYQEDVDVMALPGMWNDKMEEYLGIRPANDRDGILQDLHWSAGFLGYFPTYLLGSIYDGMFLEAMEKELGSMDDILSRGGVLQATGWLKENIFRYGDLQTSPETIERVCGKPLSAKPLLNYFEKKYSKLYEL